MEQQTVGIVLRIIKYNDRTNIVDVYSQDLGRCSIAVNIAQSKRSRIKNVLFQPLSILDLTLSKRSSNGLYRLREVKPHIVFQSIPYDQYKLAIAFFISEFVYYAVRDDGESSALFSYLKHSIEWLDEVKGVFANFHLVFLMRLSLFLGLYPNVEDYTEGDYFDLLKGSFIATQPTDHIHFVSPADAAYMVRFMRMNYDTMHLFKFNRGERNQLLVKINDYYRIHLPSFPELKSIDVLKTLFD